MEKQLTSRRLVLVRCPFQGHITSMLQLGAILHSKGFDFTVAHSDFNFPGPSNYPDFDFLEMSDGLCKQNILSHNFIAAISGFNVNCKSSLQESLARKMEKEDRNSKISCIIYDEYMYFSEEVANHLGLRSIILTTNSAANVLTHQAIPRLLKHDHIPIQDSMMLELVPGLQTLRFKDLPIRNFRVLDDLLQLIAKAHDSRSSSAVIWNTMDCLEQSSLAQLQNEYQIPLFPVGHLHKTVPSQSISLLKEDQSCMSWPDKKAHNSVIYVSLGSTAFMDSKELEEMAWGLANSEQPFLWVVRTDSVSLPKGFQEIVGERGHIVKWTPQKKSPRTQRSGRILESLQLEFNRREYLRRSPVDMSTIFWGPESELEVFESSMGSRSGMGE